MILLRFGRERRNFMACKRAEEHNIYFRDVYIIHLARRDKKKNMLEMQKPEEKK